MPDLAIEASATPASLSALHAQVTELRAAVDALRAQQLRRRRITLQAARRHAFLGQPLTVSATLTDAADGRPRVGVPVTFVATWGRVRPAGGVRQDEAHAATLSTDADGSARVVLKPPTSEGLIERQQQALEAALQRLDADAPTPRAVEEGLREMARHYRWEAGAALREAVDLYLRDFRPRLLDTVNAADYMAAWRFFDCTLLAFAPADADGAAGTTIDSTAALPVRFKDWLSPWLETCLAVAEADSALGQELDSALLPGRDASGVLADVYGRLRDFKDRQYGLAGQYLGQRIADRSLRSLASERLGALPLDTQVQLGSALHSASETIASAGLNTASAVGHVQATLGQDLTQRIEQVKTVDLGRVTGSLSLLEGRVQELSPAVGNLRTEMLGLIAGKANVGAVEGLRAQLDGKLDAGAFQTFQGDVNTRLGAKAERAEVTALRADLDTKASRAEVATLDGRVGTLAASTTRLDQSFTALDTSVGRLNQELITLRPVIVRPTNPVLGGVIGGVVRPIGGGGNP